MTTDEQVPVQLRPALMAELDALVRGERPEMLIWVREYGSSGATLIEQPEAIWSHPRADAVRAPNGEWQVVVPLWTTAEAPSDLSAEITVDECGETHLIDVHVL